MFVPNFAHPLSVSYTAESASSGIQETLNTVCGTYATSGTYGYNSTCNVTLPASGPNYPTSAYNNYIVYGTIFMHFNEGILEGHGARLLCEGRGPCMQMGDQAHSTDYNSMVVNGISFRAPISRSASAAWAGSKIVSTQVVSNVATVVTASAHGFLPGDIVTIQFTDNYAYWGDAIVSTVPNATSFTFAHPKSSPIASANTPGVVALAYEAILDNATNTRFNDINYDLSNAGHFNTFFDFWDDENAVIDNFNNYAQLLNRNINWAGSFIFSGGAANTASGSQQFAPVITVRNSNITANSSSCATVYNSNGIYIDNSVCQSTGLWELNASNTTGNYQGATLKDLYSNGSNAGLNPLTPTPLTPYPGLGGAGLIAGPSTSAATFSVLGNGGVGGYFPTGGSGATAYTYYIVANDWASPSCGTGAHVETSPMQILNYLSTGSDSPVVSWPRVPGGTYTSGGTTYQDSICYDVIRYSTPGVIGSQYPASGACGGGSTSACGSVTTGLTQSTACGNTLTCTFTDTASASTSSYSIVVGNYTNTLPFWPGAIVNVGGNVHPSVKVNTEQYPMVAVGIGGNAIESATECTGNGQTASGGYVSCIASLTSMNNSVTNQTATLFTDGPTSGGPMTVSKGRLNIIQLPGVLLFPHHFFTLIDSQPGVTTGTIGYRPLASANDTWIGTDVAASTAVTAGQLAFGAPVAISHYIANTGSTGTGWLERLTSSLKEFNVAAQFDASVTITPLSDGCLNVTSHVVGSSGSPCGGSNPLTTLGDTLYGGASGVQTRLAGPVAPNGIPQTLTALHLGRAAVAEVWSIPGVGIDAQTGTTYPVPITDDAHFLTLNNSSAVAVSGFALANNYVFSLENLGSGLVTYTPNSGLVNGASTQIVPQNYFGFHYTDNTNTFMPVMPTLNAFPNCPGGSGASGQALNIASATGTITCPTTRGVMMVTGSDYTNGTTGLTNITGLSFSMAASTNYTVDCDLIYQGSASTAALQVQPTGPASPTALSSYALYTLTDGSSPTFYSHAVNATSFSGIALGPTAIVTTSADLGVHISYSIVNGTNSGTWQLQGKSASTGTVTVKVTSSCKWQEQYETYTSPTHRCIGLGANVLCDASAGLRQQYGDVRRGSVRRYHYRYIDQQRTQCYRRRCHRLSLRIEPQRPAGCYQQLARQWREYAKQSLHAGLILHLHRRGMAGTDSQRDAWLSRAAHITQQPMGCFASRQGGNEWRD